MDRASRWALLTLTITLAMDQVTKALVRSSMHPGQSEPLIPGVLYLTYVRNPGGAFGLMPGSIPLFVLVATSVIIAIAAYWVVFRPHGLPMAIGLGLVAAGAAGNLIDRVMTGLVTDFFDVRIWPVFNIADSAIVVGVVIVGLWVMFGPAAQDA